jgi:hypothetical protein
LGKIFVESDTLACEKSLLLDRCRKNSTLTDYGDGCAKLHWCSEGKQNNQVSYLKTQGVVK